MARILGIVLAGGRSSRFGSDKAAALLHGRPLIAHAHDALAPLVETVAIVGRDVAWALSLPDRPAPGLGPLGGLAGALQHAASHGYAGVLATGCDMPVFPATLAEALSAEGDAAVLAGQQLAGYWPAALASTLEAHLAATQDRSIAAWLRVCGARTVAMPFDLPNINTPADLAALAAAR